MGRFGICLAVTRDDDPWPLIGTFAGLLVLAVAWAWWRNRSAPRTIANWSGSGIHEGLGAPQAGILLRADPALTVAAAFALWLGDGRARIAAHHPLTIRWNESPDPLLAAAVGEDGRLDLEGVCAILEALHAEVEERMDPYSGRRTAVHYRNVIRDRWERHLAGEPVADREWLILLEPRKVWDRIPSGPAGELLHDLVRLGGLFRRAVPRDLLVARARGARSGFFAYRSDLLRGRADSVSAGGEPTDRRAPPRTPLARTVDGLARELEGTASGYRPDLGPVPIAVFLTSTRPSVGGRFEGRPVSVRFVADNGMKIQMACSSVEELTIGEAGDESGLPLPVQRRIEACRPFESLRGANGALDCRAVIDPDSIRPEEVLERLRRLDALARTLEEKSG